MKRILIAFIVCVGFMPAFATTWTVTNSNFIFLPDVLDINVGDTVIFQLPSIHNAQEVDQNTWNANGNFPVTGFQTPFGGGKVTGLTTGTHYYVCQSHSASGMKGQIIVHPQVIPNAWINEIHYDNAGTDTLEGFEVAGVSGSDLACFKVALYDSATGQDYFVQTLTGLLPFQTCAFGFKWFSLAGADAIHNSPGDAIALIYAPQSTGCGRPGPDTVIQFLSYAGTLTASSGPAIGKTSVNIGVAETGNDIIGKSLQLSGTGTSYGQFSWQNAANSSYGAINPGQNVCSPQHISISPLQIYQYEFTGSNTLVTFSVILDNPGQNPTSVTLRASDSIVSPLGKATRWLDYVFKDTTVTWPANFSGPVTIPIYIVDDTIYETHEDVFVVASGATNGATVTGDSIFNLGIIGNDDLSHADCTDLFFSEYMDGSGNNKALEIYNPNNNVIDLSEFKIFKSINGGTSVQVFGLSGLLANKQVYVAANSQASPAIQAKADTLSSFFDFDGNDAIALVHLVDTIDVIGQLRVDPGSGGWTLDSGGTTQGHTLIRTRYIYAGQKDWAIADTQWMAYPIDMTDSLGFHHTGSPCGSGVPPPPATLQFVSTTATVYEGDTVLRVAVRIDNPSNVPAKFSVQRNDSASTASPGQDYTYTIKIFSHGLGITYDTVELTVKEDALTESTETAVLHFINTSSNVIIGPDSTYTLSIIDTDKLTISFLGAGFSYVEDAGQVKIRVTVSTPVDTTLTVVIDTTRSNALPGIDYTFMRDTLVFPPNTIDTQFALITIIDDNIPEGNEQINFDIKSVTGGAVVAISAYTLTIIDNDLSEEVGINEISFGDLIKLFPNPARNVLNIETSEDLSEIKIFDLPGNLLIDAGPVSIGKKSVNLTQLPAGMYFLSAKANDRIVSARFIKAN